MASRRVSISAISASGVVTGREHVCPWHSIAIGLVGSRQVGARRTLRPSSPIEPHDGQGRIGRAKGDASERLRGRIVERPIDDDRAAAREHVGAHERERARAKPFRRAGDRPDEALRRLAPAGFVGQMPEADEGFGQ